MKPAEQTPLSAIAFAEVAVEAGVPAGVLNLLTGDPAPIAEVLLEDDGTARLIRPAVSDEDMIAREQAL